MLENSNLPENHSAAAGKCGEEESGARRSLGHAEEERAVGGEDGERNWGGNRWPRQEALALLKIRSDMDTVFRDASVKAPLWEEVSRKLAELGCNRSAKKCKEKFENIYKYHKRTKEGRSSRPNAKSYRFFEQLEALDNHSLLCPPPPPPPSLDKFQASLPEMRRISPKRIVHDAVPCSVLKPGSNFSDTSSYSTSSISEKDMEAAHKKKRKLSNFFDRLMKEVIEKQENLQKKFLDVLDKCEQDRIAREEAWKTQELDRIKRERELLLQERSIAAAKDAAVLAFLKKFSEQMGSVQLPDNPIQPEPFMHEQDDGPVGKDMNCRENGNGGNSVQMCSSRWPKDEVEALIRLRTNLDLQYQDAGPKGPLWEEISLAMKKIGYDRSAKRCKEKWENINKYFKRVKESSKKRPEDSKTCPYFHQLDALYKEKTKKVESSVKPEELLMQMLGRQEHQGQGSAIEDGNMQNIVQNQGNEEENFHRAEMEIVS